MLNTKINRIKLRPIGEAVHALLARGRARGERFFVLGGYLGGTLGVVCEVGRGEVPLVSHIDRGWSDTHNRAIPRVSYLPHGLSINSSHRPAMI